MSRAGGTEREGEGEEVGEREREGEEEENSIRVFQNHLDTFKLNCSLLHSELNLSLNINWGLG